MDKKEIEVKMVQYFDEHWYKIVFEDGREEYYASATTKLSTLESPGLAKWRGDIGNREADWRSNEASNRGKRIHRGLETICKDGVVIYNNWEFPQYTSDEINEIEEKHNGNTFILNYQDEMYDIWKLQEFFKIVKPKIIGVEKIVYSHKYKDAGTVDLILDIEAGEYASINSKPLILKKGIYITDLKTGGVYDKAYMQMADYGYCHKEMTGDKIAGAIILHTGAKVKTGIPGFNAILRTSEELNADFKDFRSVAELWHRKNKNAGPKLFEFPAMISL